MKGNTDSRRADNLSACRKFCFILISIILVIIILEVGLRLLDYTFRPDDQSVVDTKMLLSPYRDKPWAEKYFTEMHQREIQYEPYYGWSLKPFTGEHVNIDSAGLRKTWNRDFDQGVTPDTIYIFGGSTIWGGGSRDDYSIPSYLSKFLNEKGYRVHVKNYGVTGHVFTQEVVRLMMLLREGHRPDHVIFYDGTNDVYSAFQSGVAGTFQNVARTRERLAHKTGWNEVRTSITKPLREHSWIYRGVRKLVAMVWPRPAPHETAEYYSPEKLNHLADNICKAYWQSMDLLDHLARQYDFKYICFWQPVAFLEKELNPEESASDNRLADSALAELFQNTNELMATSAEARFFNITNIFSARNTTYYVDFCHLSEEGNEVVARSISNILEKEIFTHGKAGNN